MSWEATAYVNTLKECCDGAQLSRGQKLVLFSLADHHNRSSRDAYPSLPLLADETLTSLSSLKRDLKYLEDHCVIEQRHPKGQGRGKLCTYVFLFLDDQDRLRVKLTLLSKGVQGEPLFCPPKRGSEGVQIEGERGSEGVQIEPRNKEVEPGTKSNHRTITPDGALNLWLRVKAQLERNLPADEVKLWVKPARLQRVIDGCHMLIALPPSNRIMKAASARRDMLRAQLAAHGYNASFVKYADEYDKAEARRRYEVEVQPYGTT